MNEKTKIVRAKRLDGGHHSSGLGVNGALQNTAFLSPAFYKMIRGCDQNVLQEFLSFEILSFYGSTLYFLPFLNNLLFANHSQVELT